MIEVHDDDPAHFKLALQFIYTERYDELAISKLAAGDNVKSISIKIAVLAIADKYDIDRLPDLITDDMVATFKENPPRPALKAAIEGYYKDHRNPNTTMGTHLVLAAFRCTRQYKETATFTDLMLQYPMFGTDFAIQLLGRGTWNVNLYYITFV